MQVVQWYRQLNAFVVLENTKKMKSKEWVNEKGQTIVVSVPTI